MGLKYFEDLERRGFGRSLVFFTLVSSFLLVLLSSSCFALVLSDQAANVKFQGSLIESGNLQVFIYDDAVAGNLVYNDSFSGSITEGAWSVTLGEQVDLTLEYGKAYYTDYKIDGTDIDFTNMTGGTTERKLFYSPVGLINGEDISTNAVLNIADISVSGDVNVSGSITSPTISSLSNLSLLDISFNLGNWSADKGSYASVVYVDSLGNWSLDKQSYYNQSLVDSNFLKLAGGNVSGSVDVSGTVYATSFVGDGSLLSGVSTSQVWSNVSGNATFTSGNVGIGTATPGKKLVVVGSERLEGQLMMKNNAGAWSDTRLDMWKRSSSNDFMFRFVNDTDSSTIFDNVLVLKGDTGNVGIGTDSPGAKLDVAGSGNVDVLIKSSNDNARLLLYADDDGNGTGGNKDAIIGFYSGGSLGGEIRYDNTSDTLELAQSSDGGSLVIGNNGNIGIGTTAPLGTLHVNGVVGANSLLVTSGYGGQSSTPKFYFSNPGTSEAPSAWGLQLVNNDTTDGNRIRLGFLSIDDSLSEFGGGEIDVVFTNHTAGATAADMIFKTRSENAQAESMRITGNGNVGIGTATPGSKLDIRGDMRLQDEEGGLSEIYFYNASGTRMGRIGTVSSLNSLRFIAGAGSTSMVTLDSSGNVGIGTTSPAQALDVDKSARFGYNSGSNAYIEVRSGTSDSLIDFNDNTGVTRWEIREDSGDLKFNTETNANNKVTFLSDGNVGIGTTSPQVLLHVSKASENDLFEVESNNSYAQMYLTGASGQDSNFKFREANTDKFLIGWDASDSQIRFRDLTGNSDRMVIKADGNVGIGTTAPQGLLVVSKEMSAATAEPAPLEYDANTSSEWNQAVINYYNLPQASLYTRILDIAAVGRSDDSSYGDSVIRFLTNPVTLDSKAVERMRITGTGNVGIGTTSPDSQLHVKSSSSVITIESSDTNKKCHLRVAATGSCTSGWTVIGTDDSIDLCMDCD